MSSQILARIFELESERQELLNGTYRGGFLFGLFGSRNGRIRDIDTELEGLWEQRRLEMTGCRLGIEPDKSNRTGDRQKRKISLTQY